MKKSTGRSQSCVFRALLILLIVVITVSGCALHGTQNEDPTESIDPNADQKMLISTLTNYLKTYNEEDSRIIWGFSAMLSFFEKSGANQLGFRTFLVNIDPEKYYYMCGYYNCEHTDEVGNYTCADAYTWIKFESANEIQEYYSDEKIVIAFQINGTKDTQHLIPVENDVPSISFYQIYATEFINGYNIAEPYVCNEPRLVGDRSGKNPLYFNDGENWPFVVLDETFYLTEKVYTVNAIGEEYAYNLEKSFGKYYDALMQVMITDKYSETDENNNTIHYGLFRLEDIVNILLNWEDA